MTERFSREPYEPSPPDPVDLPDLLTVCPECRAHCDGSDWVEQAHPHTCWTQTCPQCGETIQHAPAGCRACTQEQRDSAEGL